MQVVAGQAEGQQELSQVVQYMQHHPLAFLGRPCHAGRAPVAGQVMQLQPLSGRTLSSFGSCI